MFNIELIECGLDDTLREIRSDLESVLGRSYSKKQKDEMIYKTLSAVNTLLNIIRVTEVYIDTEDKSDV